MSVLNPQHWTIKQLSEALNSKKISSVELTQFCLDTIKKKNPDINAFVSVQEENALQQATFADELIAKGKHSKLTGIPLGVKDNFCEKGVESTACSAILKGFIPPYEGKVMQNLRKTGAVFIGHTNTDEFTMGASTESSIYGPTKNPLNTTKSSGGSSGGSAAAVASGLVPWALGTDTGGSIRQPASFCGVTGLKVSYGRVSRYGVMSMASSLDTIGPICKTPEDASIILEEIAGKDIADATTIPEDSWAYDQMSNKKENRQWTLGIYPHIFKNLDKANKKIFEDRLQELKKEGFNIKEINLPHFEYAVDVYYIIAPSEISANMSRYDGIRFGRAHNGKDLIDAYYQTRTKGFSDEVKRRIIMGTFILSAGYQDAYYKKALKIRSLIKQDFEKAFETVDAIVCPTTPNTAFTIGSHSNNPLAMYLEDILTTPASIAGIPAISIPSGKINELPTGFQIMTPFASENKLIQLSHKIFGIFNT